MFQLSRTHLRIASNFFLNLSAGYFFAAFVPQSAPVLLNNVILCIVSIGICVYIEGVLEDEF
jgi:hypothetical protein